MRRLFGTVAGVAVAILILFVVDYVDGWLYPLPVDVDPDDGAAVAGLIYGMPLPAKLIIAAAWPLAAFCGAWMALRIADWRWSAALVALFVTVAGICNFLWLPHPVWMEIAAVALPPVGGVLASWAHRKPYPGEPLLG